MFAVAVALGTAPAVAQEHRVRIGLGPQIGPDYPGSDGTAILPLFDFSRVKGDAPLPFTAADESFGPPVVRVDGFAFGPSFTLEGERKRSDTGGRLPKVNTTIEAGAFAQAEFANFRLRAEARKGLGGHKGFVADLSADFIARDADNWLFALGPRMRIANGRYQRAYYGVATADAVPGIGLAAYDPDGGIGSVGAAANAVYALTPTWGVTGYVRYDRLTGDAKDSPVVRLYGDRNQFSGGMTLTYTFRM